MSDCTTDDPAEPSSLACLLERAGVHQSSIIRITGPSALPALLWLCRHGYEHAGYMRPGQGAPHEEGADALLVAHTCSELELKLLLPTARDLKPGGVFVVRLRTEPGSSLIGVERLLARSGLAMEHRIQNGVRALIVARRAAVALQKVA